MLPSAPINVATQAKVAATSTTLTVGAPKVGNTVFVVCAHNGGFITSIAQTGVTWAAVDTSAGANIPTEIWIGTGVTASGGTSCAINFPSAPSAAFYFEWPGVLLPVGTDQHNHTSGSSATVSSGSVTPTKPNELIIAAGANSLAITGAPSGGFSAVASPVTFNTSDSLAVAYLAQGAAAAISTTWATTSGGWEGVIASFFAQPNPQLEPYAAFLAQ